MNTLSLGLDGHNIEPDSEQLFEYISSYPFQSDQEYQSGLAAIFGHPETPATEEEIDQNKDLVLQAQCFYLARTRQLPRVDVDGYRHWLITKDQSSQDEKAHEDSTINGTEKASAVAANANVPALTNVPDPIARPHAPTPTTAAAASTLDVQPNSQTANTDRPAEVANATAGQGPAPPYPTSFADIVDLITQNKPVPGIEEVPDTVLELGSSKRDTATRRKKPWEKDDMEPETQTQDVAETTADDVGVERRIQTGQGVLKILQPGAIPDSGLIAGD